MTQQLPTNHTALIWMSRYTKIRLALGVGILVICACIFAACDSTPPQPILNGTATPAANILPTNSPVVATPTQRIPLQTSQGKDLASEELLQKWKLAVQNLVTVKATTSRVIIDSDGTRRPPTRSESSVGINTDELYDLTNVQGVKYRVVRHLPLGDELIVFDGHRDYNYSSWIKSEISSIYADNQQVSGFWIDNIDELGMFDWLFPPSGTYSLGEKIEINGHKVTALTLEAAPNSTGNSGNIYYIDDVTNLPYRVRNYAVMPDNTKPRPALELTFTNMEVNQPVTRDELREGLPPLDAVAIIYGRGPWADPLTTYTSLYDEKLKPGFTLFDFKDGTTEPIETIAFTEQNNSGTLVPLIQLARGTVIEGLNLPDIANDSRYNFDPLIDPNFKLIPPNETIQINKQPATLYNLNGTNKLRMQREGTWLQIDATDRAKTIEIAQDLHSIHRAFDK